MIFTVVVIRLLGSAVFIRGLGWVEGQGGQMVLKINFY